MEDHAKKNRRQDRIEMRLGDDASVRSPVLINRLSHADPSRILTLSPDLCQVYSYGILSYYVK